MNPEYMEVGMKVIIHDNISQTEVHFGVNSDMKIMRSCEYLINDIIKKDYGNAARINGYTWHAEDFHPVDFKDKKAQPFHFDVKDLSI